jgi:putative nucleotidyltransferase with HDIG domain
VLHLDRGPQQQPFTQEDFKLADAVAATVSVGIESAVAVEKQRSQSLQEVIAFAKQIMAMRHDEIRQHCERVAQIALLLADELRLSTSEKDELQAGALLHDLGKIGMPDRIVSRRSKRNPAEEQELRQHPLLGVAIAEKFSGFAAALPIIRHHHECWDGSGYPDGLSGEQIPRCARIVAVADAVENLSDHAGGRLQVEETIQRSQELSGIQLDPHIVKSLGCLRSRLGEASRHGA